jgi:aryl-alcohol dehydrogenase-like predicted oxidoreductase
MDFQDKRSLGRTGIMAGRLGIASSYGAPAEAYEEAFERGCNYFMIGSFLKGRSPEMVTAVKNICRKGRRDDLILALNDYTHNGLLQGLRFHSGLKTLGLGYIDILILGYYLRKPCRGVLEGAMKLKEAGLIRHIAIASHNRSLFKQLLKNGQIDVFHVRYNAVHRGAEHDVFPSLPENDSPGIVSYTATRWGQLLKESKMPSGEKPLTASDCYRFVLFHPKVNVCMMGTRTQAMMKENLRTLEMGPLSADEMARIRRIGDHIYGKKRESQG